MRNDMEFWSWGTAFGGRGSQQGNKGRIWKGDVIRRGEFVPT